MRPYLMRLAIELLLKRESGKGWGVEMRIAEGPTLREARLQGGGAGGD